MKNMLISVSPHVSGPFTFYKKLKEELQNYGWNVLGLTLDSKNNLDGFLNIMAEHQDEIKSGASPGNHGAKNPCFHAHFFH